jgi:hypothetical protein
MAEAAIALSYSEPYNQGKLLGFWLSFRVGGQVLCGATNLGLNTRPGKFRKISTSLDRALGSCLLVLLLGCCSTSLRRSNVEWLRR